MDLDVEAYRARCQEAGVYFQVGRQFALDGAYSPNLRIGFATLDAPRLTAATSRMLRALRGIPARASPRTKGRRIDSIDRARAPMGSQRQSVPVS